MVPFIHRLAISGAYGFWQKSAIAALFSIFWFPIYLSVNAQAVSGCLSSYAGRPIKLEGFTGLKTYFISSDTTDKLGNFRLNYSQADFGVGCLKTESDKLFIILLSGEDVELKGEALEYPESIRIAEGAENEWFEQYAKEHPRREQALSAWDYLEKMYITDPMFSKQNKTSFQIQREKQRIKNEDAAFLNALPKDSYVRWFLPVRKLVSNVSNVAQYRTGEIPATRKALRELNYVDARLYKSGLFRDALVNHIWFLENSSGPLDSVFTDINRSLDIILSQLQGNEALFNEVTDYLFRLLEKRSLFSSAEYLALKVLNEVSCTVNQDLASQLEGYRKMKVGNTAPDIEFGQHTYFAEGLQAKSLRELPGEFKVVVFAAGWCGHCQQEIPKLAQLYPEWKAKGIEVVLVSLDENVQDFVNFTAALPFTSTTDYGKWESKPAKDYLVFGTPTLFLLDKDLKILLKPQSVEQVKAWLEYAMSTK